MEYPQRQNALYTYRIWLVCREYSPATIEKYTHVLARFFQESRLEGDPTKEDIAAWRDGLAQAGYSAASVNAMLAAVAGYQEFRGNPQEKAKPLKRQRRAFREEKRELSREEYMRLLDAAREQRQQAYPPAAPDPLRHGHPGVRAAGHHRGGGAPGPGLHPVQGQVPGDFTARRPVQPAEAVVR